MKTIFSALGGALTLTEQSGTVTLSWDESIGGGLAAGIVKGQGSLVLNGTLGLQLGEKLLNAMLPASVLPLAQVVETVANQAIAAIE
jgi:hypothetical protein